MRRIEIILLIALLPIAVCSINFLSCSSVTSLIIPYNPVITFTGRVNNDSLYYPGNRSFPNSCRIMGDCVRMYFYSEDYSQGPTNHGDQMRIDVYSLDSQFITERHSIFVFTRYDQGNTTPTYTIVPADTLNDYNNFHAKVESFERRQGGAIRLQEISVMGRPLGQYASAPLSIAKGVISGIIE